MPDYVLFELQGIVSCIIKLLRFFPPSYHCLTVSNSLKKKYTAKEYAL